MGILYVLDYFSRVSTSTDYVSNLCNVIQNLTSHLCNVVQATNKDNYSILHKRLEHSSEYVLSHLKFVSRKADNEMIPCIPFHQEK